MSKRRRFVISSILLSLGFVGIQFLTDQNRFWAIGLLGLATILLFSWSLYESLGRNMTLLTLILPTIFTLGVGTFWFLLPANIFARIPVVIFYGIGMYVLSLTMNIFTVSAIRTIALLRAARGVGFVLNLITSFLVFDAILSLRYSIFYFLPLVLIVSFPLLLQGFWSVVLEKEYSPEIFVMAAISALVMVETAAALYFWPVTVVVGSLFLTVTFYILLGLGQSKLEGRLFSATVREHLVVGVSVFIAMFLATHWGV
ncbi:MAG TPA: hypothetical protein VKC53_03110 [Patescibacteria group bacterium]|nr:hypothetical protein [Patescibacteria group bacterium]